MFSFAHDDDLVLDYLAKFVEGGTQNKIEQEQFIRIKKYDISKDYTFLEKLGEGAFGEVYKCENRRTGEARAVKILKRNIFTNPRVKEQFLQEFNILKKTSHPNIIRIYEIYQFSNYMYIISELCSGGSLGDFLRHVPKPS
jgi:calcium-dependent protein kinase